MFPDVRITIDDARRSDQREHRGYAIVVSVLRMTTPASFWQSVVGAMPRIPWLLIPMLSATFTGMVTTIEEAFVSLPLLYFSPCDG